MVTDVSKMLHLRMIKAIANYDIRISAMGAIIKSYFTTRSCFSIMCVMKSITTHKP